MWRRLVEVPRLLFIGALFVLVAVLRANPRMTVTLGRVPRTVTVGAVLCALASATLAFAAGQQTPPTAAARPLPTKPEVVTVPDVRGQKYVFAQGMLEEAGFAWQVTGSVGGYAVNTVASQTPAPGTRVYDSGAPTVILGLARSTDYREAGAPANESPYRGTPIELVGVASTEREERPPAFTAKGAPRESLDQSSLPERAENLAAWLETHREPTPANLRHWRYEHKWIVAGARFGWWRGADALQTLIRVDRRVQALWGTGKKQRVAAKRALDEVRAQAR